MRLSLYFQIHTQRHHTGSLKSTTVGVFTPRKSANTTNLERWVLNIYQHTCGYIPVPIVYKT